MPTQAQTKLTPIEAAFLFVDPKQANIIPLDKQKEIKAGDKIATEMDNHQVVGLALWQGVNDLCWACEVTADGKTWSVRVIRVCEMVPVTRLEYAEMIGAAKFSGDVLSEPVGHRLQQWTAQVAKNNKIGNPNTWCEQCQIPLIMVVERKVSTTIVLDERPEPNKFKVSESEDIEDKVVKAELYCAMCNTHTPLKWADVEIAQYRT